MNQIIIDWDELRNKFIFLGKCIAEGERKYGSFDGEIEIQ